MNLQSFLEPYPAYLHSLVYEKQTGRRSGPIKPIIFKLFLSTQEQGSPDFIKKSVPRQMEWWKNPQPSSHSPWVPLPKLLQQLKEGHFDPIIFVYKT